MITNNILSINPFFLLNALGYQFLFRLNFDNRDYLTQKSVLNGKCLELERMPSPASNNLSSLSSSILLQLFPFSLIFRKDLYIIGTGKQLKQMFCCAELIGQDLPSVARMRRPKLKPTWDNV